MFASVCGGGLWEVDRGMDVGQQGVDDVLAALRLGHAENRSRTRTHGNELVARVTQENLTFLGIQTKQRSFGSTHNLCTQLFTWHVACNCELSVGCSCLYKLKGHDVVCTTTCFSTGYFVGLLTWHVVHSFGQHGGRKAVCTKIGAQTTSAHACVPGMWPATLRRAVGVAVCAFLRAPMISVGCMRPEHHTSDEAGRRGPACERACVCVHDLRRLCEAGAPHQRRGRAQGACMHACVFEGDYESELDWLRLELHTSNEISHREHG
eukprot:1153045-Pelagomonas_calceolata.AAC.3